MLGKEGAVLGVDRLDKSICCTQGQENIMSVHVHANRGAACYAKQGTCPNDCRVVGVQQRMLRRQAERCQNFARVVRGHGLAEEGRKHGRPLEVMVTPVRHSALTDR